MLGNVSSQTTDRNHAFNGSSDIPEKEFEELLYYRLYVQANK